MLKDKKTIKNILFVRNDRLGEFLLNIPLLNILKQNFNNARIIAVINPYLGQLAKKIPFIDEIIFWQRRKHSLREKFKFIRLLKTKNIDMAIISNPSREFNFYTYLAGVSIRVGYNRKCGFLLNYRVPDTKFEGARHEADYNLDLARALGVPADIYGLPLFIDIKDADFPERRMKQLGLENKSFLAVHPWASNKDKEWPLEKFRELIIRINSELKIKIVIIGSQEGQIRAERLFADLPILNLVGKTSLLELGGLLKRSRLLVTGDSGPMHLAAIVGTSTVAMFRKGPVGVSQRRWGPLGDNHIVIENGPINNIRIDEVFGAVKGLLS